MLGRLRMSIEDCIAVYAELSSRIFARKKPFFFVGRNKYDHVELERLIRDVVERHAQQRNAEEPRLRDPLIINEEDKSATGRGTRRPIPCRVGVLAMREDGTNHKYENVHMFRSYQNPTQPGGRSRSGRKALLLNLDVQQSASICKIARATSAAPTYFRPVTIEGLKYIDGGVEVNNPTQHAWAEAASMHKNHPAGPCPNSASHSGIRFLVSVGTGLQASQRVASGGLLLLRLSLLKKGVKSMTDPEKAHEWMTEAADASVYYRFNVDRGMEDMRLDECQMHGSTNYTLKDIAVSVHEYVNKPEIERRLIQLARGLVNHRRQTRGYPSARPEHPTRTHPLPNGVTELSASSPQTIETYPAYELPPQSPHSPRELQDMSPSPARDTTLHQGTRRRSVPMPALTVDTTSGLRSRRPAENEDNHPDTNP
ncbi:FabD/lysophospholipase-like protein [Aureobasidium subglaciale]|nr:FabD/lysophospholipase-like protein [Aureobasidium subglaciale]KAI5230835.1 FabD/lysophospholipase-like protein [Aureobasidium subglaciale]KAI5233778.1 FabD/lysophospholipase-like protein [Aureobasidium subglaciale]KAI5267276.1 FabD/lysophospholipase-like protein [Aureobasidium subglaciale]